MIRLVQQLGKIMVLQPRHKNGVSGDGAFRKHESQRRTPTVKNKIVLQDNQVGLNLFPSPHSILSDEAALYPTPMPLSPCPQRLSRSSASVRSSPQVWKGSFLYTDRLTRRGQRTGGPRQSGEAWGSLVAVCQPASRWCHLLFAPWVARWVTVRAGSRRQLDWVTTWGER